MNYNDCTNKPIFSLLHIVESFFFLRSDTESTLFLISKLDSKKEIRKSGRRIHLTIRVPSLVANDSTNYSIFRGNGADSLMLPAILWSVCKLESRRKRGFLRNLSVVSVRFLSSLSYTRSFTLSFSSRELLTLPTPPLMGLYSNFALWFSPGFPPKRGEAA